MDVVTAYGKKSFATVQPGQTVSAAIGTGKATIPAGTVTVTGHGHDRREETTSSVDAAYNAQNERWGWGRW